MIAIRAALQRISMTRKIYSRTFLMRYWKVTFKRLPAYAMAIYPFIIFKSKDLKNNKRLVNHEKIHFLQQLELLVIFFYILYLLHYIYNLLKYKNHSKAYLNICFEREAFANDGNLNYLKERKPYSWM